MSIIRVSELGQTTGITPSSLFLTSYGNSNPRESKYITKDDLFNELATTGSNAFVGSQTITGSLTVTDIPLGGLNDSALVFNQTTHEFKYVPQTIRTNYGLFTQIADSVMISGTTAESSLIGDGCISGISSMVCTVSSTLTLNAFNVELDHSSFVDCCLKLL